MTAQIDLISYLSQIKDPRRKQGQRFELESVLLIVIMSIMVGRTHYREMEAFAAANRDIFVRFFKNSKGKLPRYTTYRDIIKKLDFANVLDVFHIWSQQFITVTEGEWFAIDGKVLRSTVTDSSNSYQNFVSIVSTFSHKKGQVIKMSKYESKKKCEISTVEDLLKTLELKGLVFTLDALHCQRETLGTIIGSENDFVVQLKGNQKNLHNAIEDTSKLSEPIDAYRSEEKKRGRHEVREVKVFLPMNNIPEGWKSINTIIQISRERTIKGKLQKEESFYISSLTNQKAIEFCSGIRGHWSIENRLHWVKDVMQGEDKAGIKKGNGIEVLSIFRTMAINMTRELGYDSLKDFHTYFVSNVAELADIFRT